MPLHDEMLAVARVLVPEITENAVVPSQASLRRGIATAYYALFHLLISAAMDRVVADSTLRSRIARSIDHRSTNLVCRDYSNAKLNAARELVLDKSGIVIPRELQAIGEAFISLQEARLEADYNTGIVFDHSDASTQVLTAEVAFLDWDQVKADPSAAVFLTEIFLRSVVRSR